MSFATRGMTRGSSSSLRQTKATPNSYFSNSSVLDYKPGISFGAPVHPQFDTATDSKYSLTLDKTGHTVNMHISGVDHPELHTNCETDNCVRRDLQEDSSAPVHRLEMSELAGKISREMVAGAQTTRKTRNAKAKPLQTTTDATETPTCVADLEIGLAHHTGVLQRTQASIQALQDDIQSMQTNIADNTDTIAVMDSGLNNHKTALLQQRSAFDTINGSMTEMNEGMNNHKYEIRELKKQTNNGTDLNTKLDGMHSGLVSHAKAITSMQSTLSKFDVDTSAIPRVCTNVDSARLGAMLSEHKRRQ